jgi:DNA-binding transcriptional MerR regulator
MNEIIKFLKSMGLGDQEIQKVLRETPVNPQGLTGTNVATGVFTKTNPKSKELVKDFPLVVERIGNPFEVNYYKGKSRDEVIKMASEHVKFLEDEIAKLADQLLNKNLQLTEQQRINLAKNLETKRRIEKDFEAFKTKPEAPVVDIKTGETVKDVETLKEKSGLVAPPTTDIGRIDLRNKQMLQKAEEFYKSQDEFQKEEAARQALIAKQYEGKGFEGGVFGPSGMYRSVARNFLLDQNAKGKIKLTDEVVKNLEERNYISGGQPLLYPDPIRIMRLHYGDDVFEKIPLDKIKTGAPSEIIEEMSKIKVNPVKVEAPATPGGYMTPGEIKANIEELENIEKMIKRRESRFADMTDQEIKNELEHYGSQKNAFEVAFGYDHPKEYEEYLKSIERKDPKKFAKGGSVESLGLDYLTGIERDYPGRSNFKEGSIPKMVKFFIDKLVEEKNFNRQLLEKTNPMLVKEMYIEKFGKLPSAEELKEIVNKQLQGKYSMETVNPKTGEVTTPTEPVTTAEKVKSYDQDMAKAADEIFPDYDDPKIAADQIAESYAQIKLGKNYDDLTSKQQNKIYSQAYDYVMNRKRGMAKEMNLEQEMNMILNQYDKSMFIKNEQGMVDVTNPENVRKMALLLKRDHPEFYKRLEGEVQTNILEDFDVTGREPNAKGGRIGYAEGSDGAPSITLDSHDKAPANMDKYPVKVGNLELGIIGAMSSGKSTPNPYVKVNTADRNISVRGRYNVPDTGVSLVGDIGDARMRNTQNINVPQYNYKESIRDVMRLNPYSVGIEYAPDQNRNINLRYDNQGNVSLRGEYKFAKGGLGYLMGE